MVNPYILNIESKVVSNHLSILRLPDEQMERLERIYRLHRKAYSTQRICDSMNKKYGTILTKNKPYYRNGIPKSKGEYVNDSKENLWFEYNKSENLVTEGY